MGAWLTRILSTVFISWGKSLVTFLVGLATKYWEYLQLKKINRSQAEKVQKLADEIKKLHEAGLPIPESLKEELRRESSKLISN